MSTAPPLPPPPGGPEPRPAEPGEPGSPSRSTAKVVLVVGGLLVAVIGVALGGRLWLGTPDPCRASTIRSARFGYCVEAPGWDYTNERISARLPYDELVHPDEASSVHIQAAEVGDARALGDVISEVREGERARAGAVVGEVTDTTVAGVPAGRWDVELARAGDPVRIREVVFVREGTAWLVRMISDPDAFETGARELERILGSWVFR